MTREAAPGITEFDLTEALDAGRERVEEALRRSVEELVGWSGSRGAGEGGGWGRGAGDDSGAWGRMAEAFAYGVLSGGKRIRPILCVAAFQACGGRDEASVHDLAVSLELIHAYSLMHDDLPCMDDAELRRGRPTTHVEHGELRTMVAGAALIPGAALQAWKACEALGLDADRCRRVVRVLLAASGAGGMVGGQALDLLGEERALEEAEVALLHGMKTGALLAAAPTMGGIAAGADDDTVAALQAYGVELGLAFQIADDILDATGSAESLGKVPSDADREKSTYVTRFGVEGARARAVECSERATDALEGGGLDSPLLAGIADYVVRRRA